MIGIHGEDRAAHDLPLLHLPDAVLEKLGERLSASRLGSFSHE